MFKLVLRNMSINCYKIRLCAMISFDVFNGTCCSCPLSWWILRSEWNSKFLKRRIISKKLPSSYQAHTLHQGIRQCIDMDCLRMAYKKNCELLTSKKINFEKATECISKQVDHCFKDILLRFVTRKSGYELNKIK